MRLLVLGASGGVGNWLVRLGALRHDVTALVRPGATFEAPANVVVKRGDPTDAAMLADAVAGQDAVLSALGLRRAGKSPWAPLRSPADLTRRVTERLIPAMRQHEVTRVAVVSAAGVGDSFARCSWPVRKLVSTANVGVAYRDLAAMEGALAASDLDWLAVRPVTLVDGQPTGAARPVERYGLASTIRRADVAAWMLNAVERGTLGRRAEMIAG